MAQRVGIFFYTGTDSIKYAMCILSLLIILCCYVDHIRLFEKAHMHLE